MTYSVRYGGKGGREFKLVESPDLVAVRTLDGSLLSSKIVHSGRLSKESRAALAGYRSVLRFPDAGVEVLAVARDESGKRREKALKSLKNEAPVRFAGKVLCDATSGQPVVYSENFFVKFEDDRPGSACRSVLRKHGLKVKRPIEYLRNGYFVEAREGTGRKVFEMAERLLQEESVELCHPELLRRRSHRGAFPSQWHLKKTSVNGQVIEAHAAVEEAWSVCMGEGITIAIIDDGVDIDHEEFHSPGKIVAARYMGRPTSDPNHANPRPSGRDDHGTACAGVAAADGRFGASGVAPRARLMPIRLTSALGSQSEADAFVYAAQNGADVISCSWGPADGDWWDPTDPLHKEVVPIPDSTSKAIEWAVANGRNGRGCVITWAAGNGNESVDNDGYASHDKVIAVAACSDLGKRSAYSDFGKAIWCSFPSSNGEPSRTPGIWTTDRTGPVGYNPGDPKLGDAAGNYCNDFGGTSSASPGAAGVAALVLSRNPELRADEVREILRSSCDRLDQAGGKYDPSGHSDFYGFGRLNARKAVDLAIPVAARRTVLHKVMQDLLIEDLKSRQLTVKVADEDPVVSVKVGLDIDHTYIGDLVVALKPPAGTGLGPIVLHRQQGGGAHNLKKTFDAVSAPALGALAGTKPRGDWVLQVDDKAREDTGKLRSFSLEFGF